MSAGARRRAIVVAGMHRSGTSAFVRCVNLLGAGIGEKLIPANWGNERGFWEDEEVVAADDAL
ncbi:MAG: sulfotransferase family protein, partial [Alphaproteobacteria bacterium]